MDPDQLASHEPADLDLHCFRKLVLNFEEVIQAVCLIGLISCRHIHFQPGQPDE